MRICVLGAGVVGITTAWMLSEQGYDVTLVDKHAAGGLGTSYGNGAQLSYSYVTPFSTPSLLSKIPGILLGRDPAIRMRPPLDRDFLLWGLRFLACCRESRVRETVAAQLALAELSRVELQRIQASHALDFDWAQPGKLVVYRDAVAFKAAIRQAELQQSVVIREILSPTGCLETEPALRIAANRLAGGIFTPTEQVGDCARFCSQLLALFRQKNNATICLNTRINAPIVRDRQLHAVKTSEGDVEADAFVVAMGPEAREFCKSVGINLPMYPIKGYSVTVRPPRSGRAPKRSVTDSSAKVVVAPLGKDRIRVAGAADFVGYDTAIDRARVELLVARARELFDVDAEGDWSIWSGLRPSTPDSRPIIGKSAVKGLFLNTGHGALGWTLACGSARMVTDMIAGTKESLDHRLFALRQAA